jgi:inosose dehydratase
MKIGCFALIEPFTVMERQFESIRNMGFEFADVTDNHDGGMLGVEYGFSSSISLDSHPEKIRTMIRSSGITLTSICAHANLLDPPSPDRYGSSEIIKAIRLAHLLGIKHVITTEGDPKTQFGHSLTPEQRLFSIKEKLYAPIEWAEELSVELLIEPHGIVTGSPDGMATILDEVGHKDSVGICLDTGNSWLAGVEPLEYIARFGERIKHVHWKDLGAEWLSKRGQVYGCGMSTIALGDGLIDIAEIVAALNRIGFKGETTLEIAGRDNVICSAQRLREWSHNVHNRVEVIDIESDGIIRSRD